MSQSFIELTRLGVESYSHARKGPSKHEQIGENGREKELWEREYGILKVIPSSTRTLPSKALLLFSEILEYQNIQKVLDVGCGIGRNSIYLARKGCDVHAVDFSETALNQLHNSASKSGVRHKIHIYNCSLENPLPFKDNSFDLVLDSYVFCHFIDDRLKQNYRKELFRLIKPGGHVFSSLFSVEDSYYRQMIKDIDDKGTIIVDPTNGIKKQLYTEQEIKDFFLRDFRLLYFVKFEFEDLVLGRAYHRSILVLILEK